MTKSIRIDPCIYEFEPSYTAMIVHARGLSNGPSDAWSIGLLEHAETVHPSFDEALRSPGLQAWDGLYRRMGAKRYKNGCSALMSRWPLPRINRLVDTYNAVSVRYMLPVGGEDADKLVGDLVLTRARGGESFVVNAERGIVETAKPGEPIWIDDAGVTCRRWNWRQGQRTALKLATTAAFFVLDSIDPYPREQLFEATERLMAYLYEGWPGCELRRELVDSTMARVPVSA